MLCLIMQCNGFKGLMMAHMNLCFCCDSVVKLNRFLECLCFQGVYDEGSEEVGGLGLMAVFVVA